MSAVLGKRKPWTDTGPDYGMLSAGGASPGAFPAMEPPDAKNDPPDANNDEDYDDGQEDSDGEDNSQMAMADAQFEAELQLRLQKFWSDEMQLLRVRARMSACPSVHRSLLAPLYSPTAARVQQPVERFVEPRRHRLDSNVLGGEPRTRALPRNCLLHPTHPQSIVGSCEVAPEARRWRNQHRVVQPFSR